LKSWSQDYIVQASIILGFNVKYGEVEKETITRPKGPSIPEFKNKQDKCEEVLMISKDFVKTHILQKSKIWKQDIDSTTVHMI